MTTARDTIVDALDTESFVLRESEKEQRAPTCGDSILRFSLTPGFSPVTSEGEHRSRFNGFPRTGKPLKRLEFTSRVHTGLKPGVNERNDADADSLRSKNLFYDDRP